MQDRLFTGFQSHDIPLEEIELPVLSSQVSNYETLVQQLHGMGFDHRKVELAITYAKASTVDEMLPYLILGEHGWDHEFLTGDPSGDCLICEASLSDHRESQGERQNRRGSVKEVQEQIEYFRRKYSKEELSVQGEICMICFEELEHKWAHPECRDHFFCIDCVHNYLQIKITEAQVSCIRCPGENCQKVFQDSLLNSLVSEELYSKYLKFKWRAELLKDPNVKWCKTLNCEGYMKGSTRNPYMICPVCRFEMCFKCGDKWHGTRTCDEVIDQAYDMWAKGKEVQLCPQCKRRIEKVDGCNHMACSVCSYEWCWLCRGKYTNNHFNSLNPFGCPDLQGEENTRQLWPITRIYLTRTRNVFIWIFIILFFPLILCGVPAAEAARNGYWALRDRGYSKCLAWAVGALYFVVVFVAAPILFLLSLPVLLVYGIWKLCLRVF